jgi:hypothetical protein
LIQIKVEVHQFVIMHLTGSCVMAKSQHPGTAGERARRQPSLPHLGSPG